MFGVGDEIPGPLDKLRDRVNQANKRLSKVQIHLMKSDLARAICPQCGFQIKYASSERWRGTLKCRDCGVRFRAE